VNLPRPHLRTAVLAAGVLLTAGVLMPPPAQSRGLVATTTLAPAGSSVVLAADAAGNAAAAWVAAGQVQVSRRAPGAAWTAAVTVSAAGVTGSEPDVAIGPDGTVAVAWLGTETGVSPNVEIALQPPGQAWVAARRVSDNENWTDRDPQVEVGPAGVATVVWAATQNGTTKTVVRSKTVGATTISTQVRLSAADVDGTFSGLSLDMNPAGDTVAAWKLDGATGYVQAARRLSGGAWSATGPVFAPTTVTDATSVAIDVAGNASAGWASGASDATALPYVAHWARAAGTLAVPSGPVSATPGRQVQVARSATGLLAVAWVDGSGLRYVDGSSPAGLLIGGGIASFSLALSSSGAAAVAYAAPGGGVVLVSRAAPTAAWTTTPVPSAAGSSPVVAAHGVDATLAWADGGAGAVQAQTLDNTAPYAVHLTAPMSVLTKGKRIKAGWIGADAWSPVTYEVERQVATYRTPLGAPATWLSTTAISGSLTAKPGETHCLRVRGTDTAGNVSAWSVPRCATTAVDDKTLKQKKLKGKSVWKTVRKAKGSYSKTYTQTSKKGATLALRVKARRIGLLVSTGKGHGSVRVSLGKDTLGTFSLASAKGAQQVIIPVTVLKSARKGSLKITVTTNGKPVRIDGVYAGPA
jgi:hypothetical protein